MQLQPILLEIGAILAFLGSVVLGILQLVKWRGEGASSFADSAKTFVEASTTLVEQYREESEALNKELEQTRRIIKNMREIHEAEKKSNKEKVADLKEKVAELESMYGSAQKIADKLKGKNQELLQRLSYLEDSEKDLDP